MRPVLRHWHEIGSEKQTKMACDSTNPANLCLLCRCKHAESSPISCLEIDESSPCVTILTSDLSRQDLSFSSSTQTPVASHSSSRNLGELTTRRSHRTMHSRSQNVHGSSLLWVLTLTTLIAVSQAASIAGRDSYSESPNGIIGTDTVHTDGATAAAVDEYLEQFGYYRHRHHQGSNLSPENGQASEPFVHPVEDNPVHHTEAEREEALKRLQGFFHLRRSGHLDAETKEIMDAKRCGVQDISDDDDDDDDDEDDKVEEGGDNENYSGVVKGQVKPDLVSERTVQIVFQKPEKKSRRKRFAVNRYSNGDPLKWRTDSLTWKIQNYSAQLSHAEQKETMRRAFALWREIIPIQFVEYSGRDEADITILFGKREHGPSPDPVFDGRRRTHNTLAHAWGPHVRSRGLPGDVHFDEDDDWSNSNELFIVAVHELGHSFGLLHSTDRSSIMFPTYQHVTKLSLDDRQAVDYLYGPASDQSWRNTDASKSENRGTKRKHFTVRPEWVTRPPPRGMNNTCDGVIVNAFLPDPAPHSKNFFIAVSGDRVHWLSPRGEIIQSEPLENVFPALPKSPDVGLSVVKDQTIFFIKGGVMWAYKEGSLLEDFPKSTDELGFPEQPLFSISMQDYDGNDRPLLFGKNYWWSIDSKGFSAGRSNPIRTFSRDLPDNIQLVAQWSDQRLYAMTNDSYVVLDTVQRSATHRNPIAGKPDWLSNLCLHIKTPHEESYNVVGIVFACLAACIALAVIGFIVFMIVRKKYF